MNRIPKPYFEGRDDDGAQRLDEWRDEQKHDELVEIQMDCQHVEPVKSRCPKCGKLMLDEKGNIRK